MLPPGIYAGSYASQMPTFVRRGKRVRVEVMRKGERYSKTFPNRTQAEQWAAQFSGPSRADNTVGDALRKYQAKVAPTKRGGRWERIRINRFLRTLEWVGRPIDLISPEDIADWRDDRLREVSRSSVQRELALLSGVFQWAVIERHWITSNPCHSVKWPALNPPRKRRVSPAEVRKILDALDWKRGQVDSINDQVAVAFLLALQTAMRFGEILSLREEQLHLSQRFVHLDKTKNGDERNVPLSKEAIRLFKMLVPVDGRMFQIHPGTAGAYFRDAVKRAGVEDLHFHDTRREAASTLSKRLDVLELAKMTGHRDLRTLLKVYYAPDPSEAAKKLG